MALINIRKRSLLSTFCRYCGSDNSVWFDEAHDEYICVECLIKEREKISLSDEPDEDKMNDRIEVKNENLR